VKPLTVSKEYFQKSSRRALAVSAILVVLLPLVSFLYIYSVVEKNVYEQESAYSVRLANYFVAVMGLGDLGVDVPLQYGHNFSVFLNAASSFEVYKVKIFSASGYTVYSSEQSEVGYVNKKPYFVNEVMSGRIYQKIIQKDHLSSSGALIKRDVVETYVPIMRDGEFRGALEVYSDITRSKSLLRRVLVGAPVMAVILGSALLAVIIFVDRRAVRAESRLEADRLRKARNNALEGLGIAEKRFQAVVKQAPLGVFLCELGPDGQAVVVAANASATTHMGVTGAGNPAGNLAKAFPALAATGLPEVVARVALQGGVWEQNDFLVRVWEADVYFDIWCFQTVPGQAAVMLMDVSFRRAAAMALLKAKEQAESANRTKSEFLANMSHEVRTPLNGVLGMLQVLQDTSLSAEQSECVVIARNAGESLLRILNDILDLSKVEAGRLELMRKPFSLRGLLASVCDFFTKEATRRNIGFEVLTGDEVPEDIVGDEVRLRQILFNLVGNAVKFTEQGHVSLHVDTSGGGASLKFEVADTGVGIGQEDQKEIFKPFIQGADLLRSKPQGTGLGLAIVRRLVDLMGGSLTLASQPGEGAVFTFIIPVTKAEVQAHEVDNDAREVSLRGTVLLAEDDAVNLISLKKLLEKRGLVVLPARNGLEVLRILETTHADVVLMDVGMPGMDGVEATRVIRSEARFAAKADIPIVAVTAHVMDEQASYFISAGMNRIVAKPVNLQNLLEVLRLYLPS